VKNKIKFPEFSNKGYCHTIAHLILDNPGWNFFLDVGPGVLESEAWIMKSLFPDRHIIGFEPQRQRYENIKETYPGQLLNVALASYSGQVHGFMGSEIKDSQFYIHYHEGEAEYLNSNPEMIECMSIDSIFSQMPESSAAFLWLDAEGSEFEILRGAVKSMIQGLIPFINIEINFDENKESIKSWPKWHEIIELLHCCGYVPVASSSGLTSRKKFEDGSSYLAAYNLTHPENNPHADIFFVWNPKYSKEIERSFFKIY